MQCKVSTGKVCMYKDIYLLGSSPVILKVAYDVALHSFFLLFLLHGLVVGDDGKGNF